MLARRERRGQLADGIPGARVWTLRKPASATNRRLILYGYRSTRRIVLYQLRSHTQEPRCGSRIRVYGVRELFRREGYSHSRRRAVRVYSAPRRFTLPGLPRGGRLTTAIPVSTASLTTSISTPGFPGSGMTVTAFGTTSGGGTR